MEQVEAMCEEFLMIDKGNVVIQGNLKEILENYEMNGTKGHSLNEIFIDKVGKDDE